MKNLEQFTESVIFTIGLLAIEGKALPLRALREGLARATTCLEGYALSDPELDALADTVRSCVLATGMVLQHNDLLYFKIGEADNVAPEALN